MQPKDAGKSLNCVIDLYLVIDNTALIEYILTNVNILTREDQCHSNFTSDGWVISTA